jgi:3-phenylpropionate/trans-cinnamate dioxygenase ferredoxin subunit
VADTVVVHLGDLSYLEEGDLESVEAGPFKVVICRVEGRFYALEDECSHAETALSEGLLEGYLLTCPLHFAQFDVRDGTHTGPPAFTGVRTFDIEEGPAGFVLEVPASKRAEPEGGMSGTMFRTR